MAILLNIDTSLEKATVCISDNEVVLGMLISEDQKNHGAFVQPAIKELCKTAGIELKQIDAVNVVGGPGSYTGLRVGMATAKGLCYALNKPLIVLNTLEVMAIAAKDWYLAAGNAATSIHFCPMIDARRMEVFTAVYDFEMNEVLPPQAMILNDASFFEYEFILLFSGNGANKMEEMSKMEHNIFFNDNFNAKHIITLGLKKYEHEIYSSLAYTEPLYVKEFYNATLSSK